MNDYFEQSAYTNRRSDVVVKSQNCIRNIEEQYRKRNRIYNVVALLLCIPTLLIIKIMLGFSSLFVTDELKIIFVLWCIFDFVFTVLIAINQKKTKEELATYRYLAEKENLIAGDTGVYGDCEDGALDIPYLHIKSVRLEQPQTNKSMFQPWVLDNPILIISTSRGYYRFYTFEGTGQLKVIIEKHIKMSQCTNGQGDSSIQTQKSSQIKIDYQTEDVGNAVKPVAAEEGRIICPVCQTTQLVSRKRCYKCGTFFETE